MSILLNGVIVSMMVKPTMLGKTERMSFAKIGDTLEMPNLIEVQKRSYKWFLDEGLKEVLRDVSPITDYSGNLIIEFLDYSIDPTPKYPEEECKERDVNYAAPLRVKVRLTNKATGGLAPRYYECFSLHFQMCSVTYKLVSVM